MKKLLRILIKREQSPQAVIIISYSSRSFLIWIAFRAISLRAAPDVFCVLHAVLLPSITPACIGSALPLSFFQGTMASADFCAFSAALRLRLRLSARSAQTSPGTTRFFPSIYLPHLPHAIPCSYWASTCWAALPSHIAFYAVSVRQARGLPVVSLFPHPASFRFRLTTDTLAFGFLLPATGRIRVFHPLETCAAGRTYKKSPSVSITEGDISWS